MKFRILYGENNSGKSTYLRNIKDKNFILAPNFDYANKKQGEKYAISFLNFLRQNINKSTSFGFENFDAFLSESFFYPFLRNIYYLYSFLDKELILETRYDFVISAIGVLIQDKIFPQNIASVVYFYQNEIPVERFFDDEGFILYK